MEFASWADKYRPRRLDDVIGQAAGIAQVRHILLNRPAHLSIAGPTGCGKTTLARIYAMAALCPERRVEGCGVCPHCQAFLRSEPPDFVTLRPSQQRIENFRELAERNDYGALFADRTVVFIDEAQSMSVGYRELLPVLEKPGRNIFIFAAPQIDDIPLMLRHRTAEVQLTHIDHQAAVEHLAKICTSERVAFEVDGLDLVASLSESLRKQIGDLQTVAAAGRGVTEAAVQTILVDHRTRWLEGYFKALFDKDVLAQLSLARSSGLRPDGVVSALQQAINAVDLLLKGVTARAGGRHRSLLTTGTVSEIAGRLQTSIGGSSYDAARFWDEVSQFWASPPTPLTDEALTMHLQRFDSSFRRVVGAVAAPDSPSMRQTLRQPRSLPRWRTTYADADAAFLSGEYLHERQVRSLYEAAAFALQHLWRPFNAAVRWSGEGAEMASMAKLAHKLSENMKRWSRRHERGLTRIILVERVEGAPLVTLVGHISKSLRDRAIAWLEKQAENERGLAFKIYDRPSARDQIERHWSLMRSLWRGIDPNLVVQGRRLGEHLGIAKPWRGAGDVEGRRYSYSADIAEAARLGAASEPWPCFSPYADGAWDYVDRGWEYAEFRARVEELKRRRREMPVLSDTGYLIEQAATDQIRSKILQIQSDRAARHAPPWRANGR